MSGSFEGWSSVAARLRERAEQASDGLLTEGQRSALRALAHRLPDNGVLIADEVGMGKTRIAACVADAVVSAGGRVAVLIPPGLGFQWRDEFGEVGRRDVSPIIRSYWAYLEKWKDGRSDTPWHSQSILLISHAFTNWRLGSASSHWRWQQLRIMRAVWKNLSRDQEDEWVAPASEQICDYLKGQSKNSRDAQINNICNELFDYDQKIYDESEQYAIGGKLRKSLEKAIGLGLGRFDLVIIDEAHKGRGVDSKLTGLVGALWSSADSRRLGLTATPVELGSEQWLQALTRIDVSDDDGSIRRSVECYLETVKKLRSCWRTNEEARKQYAHAARIFQAALEKYVVRRDKRSDKTVQLFAAHTGEPFDAYRKLSEINVVAAQLSPVWRQAICAAEALSFVVGSADDPISKRLRITIGNGHGIASLLDEVTRDNQADQKQNRADEEFLKERQGEGAISKDKGHKRRERAKWWQERLRRTFNIADGGGGLYDHPAILAAVESIEAAVDEGEKVLVFGRYTRPMRALVALLNARAMLRALDAKTPWPQSKLPGSEDTEVRWALRAAWRQLGNREALDDIRIDEQLKSQFEAYEHTHRQLREHVFNRISEGLEPGEIREKELLDKARSDTVDSAAVASLLRALSEFMVGERAVDPAVCARAFRELVTAIRAPADPTDDANLQDDTIERVAGRAQETEQLWSQFKDRLSDEYGTTRSRFARLMNGQTAHETRRLLQAAFNREQSFPRVLVAQSIVGREGLNLHKACRIVVLLHPEWNPGVVEQQIGRVDRLGSRWERSIKRLDNTSPEAPRIEIRAVVFSGTYDEHNWQILQTRWDNLRAQLHGIVVPTRERAGVSIEEDNIIKIIDSNSPNFSPIN